MGGFWLRGLGFKFLLAAPGASWVCLFVLALRGSKLTRGG